MKRLIAALAALSATPLAADSAAAIAEACGSGSNIPEPICICVGETAAERMTENQLRVVLATMTGDAATVEELRPQMEMAKFLPAAAYYATAVADCAMAGSN
jgi:hypothetical protein